MQTTKIIAGLALLLVSTGILMSSGASLAGGVPLALISVAALGMAAGALLVGTSEGGRPV